MTESHKQTAQPSPTTTQRHMGAEEDQVVPLTPPTAALDKLLTETPERANRDAQTPKAPADKAQANDELTPG